jgi:hypothetical protein
MRRVVMLSAGLIAATLVAACGLPDNGDFQPIDKSQDGFGLSEPSTTSTTLAPTTTIDGTSTTVAAATTTTTIALTEPVDIYFPTGNELTPIALALPANPAFPQVIASMLEGPPPELAAGIRRILPADADITATKSRGVVTVDLGATLFDSIASPDQPLVFGQIVLTLAGRPGVGQVMFTLDGAPMRVFRGDRSQTEPNELVSIEDYTTLTGSGEPATTTTVTTTTVAGIDPALTTPPQG